MKLCANCRHDGRQTPARWQGGRIAVCDEHKAYHERIARLQPIAAIGRNAGRLKPNFEPLN